VRSAFALRRAFWLIPLALLPLGGAWGLHSLKAFADQRTEAIVELQTLNADFHRTASDLAWAFALQARTPATAAEIKGDAARVVSDIAQLRAIGVDDTGVVQAESNSADFLATLQDALPTLGGGGLDLSTPVVAAAVAVAIAQRDAATNSIITASKSLEQQSATADAYVEVGIWIIVLVGAALLVVVMWRGGARARRTAVEHVRRRTLMSSERTYRMMFDRNPTPMCIYEPDTLRFLSVNDAATLKYGYSRGELLTMTVLDVLLEADRPSFTPSSALLQPRPTLVITKHQVRDGSIIDVEVTVDDITVDDRLVSLVLVRDVTDQRRLEGELQARAFHDSLTGLGNRALLLDRFAHAQAIRAREARPLALMVIDLDGFKATNDVFGHGVGDEVLRAVAARLRAAVRPQDTVTRLGGDEFAVLIDGCDPAHATELGGRVIAAVGAPLEVNGSDIEVTPSAGLTAVENDGVTIDEALQHADIAMYEAKSAAKGEIRVFAAGMRSGVLERLEMARDLKRAIAHDELVLHYQPIVATANPGGPLDHLEALVRWQHPTRGLLQPCDFIPVAEQVGVIVPLGAWVLRASCEQVRRWNDLGREVSVSVNVSSRELREPAFAASVAATLATTGVAPELLTLEVTETVLLDDLDQATQVLTELRRLGIQVALDDFGAGYSSLAYLDSLPVDVVKIDRAFVSGSGEATRRATLRTIAHLLTSMDVRTVAEGVETAAQLAFVRKLGIDACQGYLFSRPVPARDVLDAVSRTYADHTDTPAAA
jgi:diguanylate cyclase (GGDEF)-like protein/PAS domain S-box-containing protein